MRTDAKGNSEDSMMMMMDWWMVEILWEITFDSLLTWNSINILVEDGTEIWKRFDRLEAIFSFTIFTRFLLWDQLTISTLVLSHPEIFYWLFSFDWYFYFHIRTTSEYSSQPICEQQAYVEIELFWNFS